MQEAVTRLSEIQDQINALVKEGIKLAEDNGLTFSLRDTEFAGMGGQGGLRWVPEDSEEGREREKCEYYDEWQRNGWITSSSECD